MEQKNLRTQKKLQFKNTILNAAAQEFKERGFLNTSISNIMQTAGLGVGTFYNYFNSKEEVLMNLVKNLFMQVEEKISAQTTKKSSSLELLNFACQLTTELIDNNRFILPLISSAMEYSDKPEQIPKNISPGFRKIFDEIIQRGQNRGEFRADVPADLVSELFHSIYQAAAFSKLQIQFKDNVNLKLKILIDGLKVGTNNNNFD